MRRGAPQGEKIAVARNRFPFAKRGSNMHVMAEFGVCVAESDTHASGSLMKRTNYCSRGNCSLELDFVQSRTQLVLIAY